MKGAPHHGHASGNKKTRTYTSWSRMTERCKPTHIHHKNYVGISVCKRWENFSNFLEDMGVRPPGKSLDRFPNDRKVYNKENCRWATAKEQCRNRRGNKYLRFKGIEKTQAEWSEITGISVNVIRSRFRLGWTIERALSVPVHKKRV